jgi:starch phosphorylase
LEKWSVGLIGKLLPRHLNLIYLINFFFLEKIRKQFPGDEARITRMAFLSIICSHTVNGVAALHSELLRKTIFKDFHEMFPGKIQNKTNGVTPRRWIHACNPGLSKLICEKVGDLDEWITNMTTLRDLAPWADDQ